MSILITGGGGLTLFKLLETVVCCTEVLFFYWQSVTLIMHFSMFKHTTLHKYKVY